MEEPPGTNPFTSINRSNGTSANTQTLPPAPSLATTAFGTFWPATKLRFEAVGAAYVRNDEVCRAFKASVRVQGREEKLVGAACRLGAVEWTVQKAKSAPPPG